MQPDNRTAIVTGASSGIGAATAVRLVNEGYHVHALARRRDRLDALAESVSKNGHARLTPHQMDVTDSSALLDLAGSIGPVNVLINNAGLGRMNENLANSSISDITDTINTNVTASMVCARAVLPAMIEQGQGHIVNIGSMAGLYPLASEELYPCYGLTYGWNCAVLVCASPKFVPAESQPSFTTWPSKTQTKEQQFRTLA